MAIVMEMWFGGRRYQTPNVSSWRGVKFSTNNFSSPLLPSLHHLCTKQILPISSSLFMTLTGTSAEQHPAIVLTEVSPFAVDANQRSPISVHDCESTGPRATNQGQMQSTLKPSAQPVRISPHASSAHWSSNVPWGAKNMHCLFVGVQNQSSLFASSVCFTVSKSKRITCFCMLSCLRRTWHSIAFKAPR